MTRRAVIVFAVLSLPASAFVPTASADAAAPTAALSRTAVVHATTATLHPVLARGFRGGFRSRPASRPVTRSPQGRSARPSRRAARPHRPRVGHFFGNVLRALGIAYLVHLLFGWGAGGGSPFGLLLVLAFGAWLVTRRRRRRLRWDGRW